MKKSIPRKVERKLNKPRCTKCGKDKPREEFRTESIRQYELPGGFRFVEAICNKCYKCKQTKRKIYNEEWRQTNPHKMKAHSEIAKALRKGELIKPKQCEMCGREGYLYAHHWDYDKPLLVTWVCFACHNTLGGIKEENLKDFIPLILEFKGTGKPLQECNEFRELYNCQVERNSKNRLEIEKLARDGKGRA